MKSFLSKSVSLLYEMINFTYWVFLLKNKPLLRTPLWVFPKYTRIFYSKYGQYEKEFLNYNSSNPQEQAEYLLDYSNMMKEQYGIKMSLLSQEKNESVSTILTYGDIRVFFDKNGDVKGEYKLSSKKEGEFKRFHMLIKVDDKFISDTTPDMRRFI